MLGLTSTTVTGMVISFSLALYNLPEITNILFDSSSAVGPEIGAPWNSSASSVLNESTIQFLSQNLVKVVSVICGDEDDEASYSCHREEPRIAMRRQLKQMKTLLKTLFLTEREYVSQQIGLPLAGLHFHNLKTLQIVIFTQDKRIVDELEAFVSTKALVHPDYMATINLTFSPLAYPSRFKSLRNFFRPCATFRLFLYEALPSEDNVLYVDTDVLFLKSAHQVQSMIRTFSETEWCGLSQDWYHLHDDLPRIPFHGKHGLNSGVAVYNLTRLRNFSQKWTNSIESIYSQYRHYPEFVGDQDIYNVYFNRTPNEVKMLPCGMNFIPQFCSAKTEACEGAERVISIIHGCAKSFFPANEETQFSLIFETIQEFDMSELHVGWSALKDAMQNKLRANQKRKLAKNLGDPCVRNIRFLRNLLGEFGQAN